MVEIKPYDELRHREQVLGLFSDVAFKSDIWNYQFLENPGARVLGFAPVVAEDKGRVVGFNGVVPVSVLWEGETRPAVWSCDFKVSAEYRGQGVGRLIKEELAQRSPILMSFGISPVAAIVLARMKWQPSHEVHFLRKIRLPRTVRDWALMLFQFGTAVRYRARWGRLGSDDLSASVVRNLPGSEQIDRLWERVATGYDKIVVRNWAYLDWRYQQHPFSKYQFIELRDSVGSLQAIGVVRADNRQARLVDYMGPARSPVIKAAIVRAMLKKWSNVAAFSAMTSDPELKRIMKAFGFYQGREQPRFFVWTSPSVFSQTEQELCTRNWFIMGGDSDGELLQSARENWNEEHINKEGGPCQLETL